MALTLVSVRWEKRDQAGKPPLPRVGHAIALIDDVVYVFGGCRRVEEPEKGMFYFRDMYRLHLSNNFRWEKINQTGDIPPGRHGHALCAVGCTLYLFGGKNDLKAFRSLQGVYAFDTRDDHWCLRSTHGTEPLALNPGIATIHHALYVIGGTENHIESNDVHVLNTESDPMTWTKLTTSGIPPSPRSGLWCVALGRIIYVFGGTNSEESGKRYTDMHILDTHELKWSCVPCKGQIPQERGHFSFTAYSNNDIYVFGGVSRQQQPLGDFHKLSLGKLKWKQPFFTGPAPSARYSHAAFTYKNGLYAFGGADDISEFNDLCVGRLINPSNRKPLKVSSTELQGYLSGTTSGNIETASQLWKE